MTPWTPRKIYLWTTNFSGADGVSVHSRQLRQALADWIGPGNIEVWALTDQPATSQATRAAANNKLQFISWAVALAAEAPGQQLIIVNHLNLLPAALACLLRGFKTITTLHGIEAWRKQSALHAFCFKKCSKILAVSGYTRHQFLTANPNLSGAPVEVLHSGSTGEPEFNTPSGDYALIVARMIATERYKGHDELLEVWGGIVAQHPTAKLFIAGTGDDQSRLIEKTAQLQLTGSVRFLGFVPDDELRELYRRCRVLAMPSRGEGFGLVFLEAMRFAKPCIGGKGAPEEVIVHTETGFIVDQDQQDLRNRLQQLFADDTLCRQMGEAGAHRYQTHFSAAAYRQRLVASLSEQ